MTQTNNPVTTDATTIAPTKAKKSKKSKAEKPAVVAAKPELPKAPVALVKKSDSMISRLRRFVIDHPELSVNKLGDAARADGIMAEDGTVRTVTYHTRQTLTALAEMQS